MKLKLFAICAILVFSLTACGTDWWAGSLSRNIDTAGAQYRVIYENEGRTTSQENVGITVNSGDGAITDAYVTYTEAAGQSQERLHMWQPDGNYRAPFILSEQASQENFLDITESKYITQYISLPTTYGSNGNPVFTSLLATKNEVKFTYPNLFGQDGFKAESYYKVPLVSDGAGSVKPDIQSATSWYQVLMADTLLGDKYRPFYAVIETPSDWPYPADWANNNAWFDGFIANTRNGEFQSLKNNQWRNTDPSFGKLRLVVYNPVSATEFLGFSDAVYGTAYKSNGEVIEYRIRPIYAVLDSDLAYGPAKRNTPGFGSTLRALVIEQKFGNDYAPVIGFHYVKARFAKNGLYAVKRYSQGETPEMVSQALKDEMEKDIPADVRDLFDRHIRCASDSYCPERDQVRDRINEYLASRKAFNLEEIRTRMGFEMLATVEYNDTSDYVWVRESCGDNCSTWVQVQVTPREQLVWNIATDPHGVDTINYMMVFFGEPATEAWGIDYVQLDNPDTATVEGGDGTGLIFAVLQILNHQHAGQITYADAVRCDQRSPAYPENIDLAIAEIFGR